MCSSPSPCSKTSVPHVASLRCCHSAFTAAGQRPAASAGARTPTMLHLSEGIAGICAPLCLLCLEFHTYFLKAPPAAHPMVPKPALSCLAMNYGLKAPLSSPCCFLPAPHQVSTFSRALQTPGPSLGGTGRAEQASIPSLATGNFGSHRRRGQRFLTACRISKQSLVKDLLVTS